MRGVGYASCVRLYSLRQDSVTQLWEYFTAIHHGLCAIEDTNYTVLGQRYFEQWYFEQRYFQQLYIFKSSLI